MNICFDYGVRWRYEFNNSKSGIVTFGETKSQHFIFVNKCSWVLGSDTVKYKNLGVLKNYVGSFSSNVTDNIEKLRKKCRKVDPLVYTSNFGGKLVYHLCCLALNFSQSPQIYYINWSAVKCGF